MYFRKNLITVVIFLIDVIFRWDEICVGDKVKGGLCCPVGATPTISIILRDRERDFHRPVRRSTVENFSIRQSSELFRAITSRSRPPTIHHRATFTKEKSRGAQWYPLIRSAPRGSVAGSIRSNVRLIKTISARVPPTRDEEISRAEGEYRVSVVYLFFANCEFEKLFPF